MESNWMNCNVKVSIWNVMRGDESDRIVNKRNGLQRANMTWDGTETVSPSTTWMIEDVDWASDALEIIHRAHGAAV